MGGGITFPFEFVNMSTLRVTSSLWALVQAAPIPKEINHNKSGKKPVENVNTIRIVTMIAASELE